MRDEIEKIPRGFEIALFGTAMLWALASSAIASRSAHGIVVRFKLDTIESLLSAVFLVFLVVVGFSLLDWIATRGRSDADALPLPRRAGWGMEWGVGAAVGWGLCLVAVLPVLLIGNLHGRLMLSGATLWSAALSALTLLAMTLAAELIARGYGFQRLIVAVGPSWASVITSFGFAAALVWGNPPRHLLVALIDGTVFGLVLAVAYLRTHALWVGWGIHFAYRVMMAVVVGLPIAGRNDFGSIMDTYTTGPGLLTGSGFGLDGALLTALVMAGGMVVVYRVTKEYAWKYTLPEIVAAGYEVTVAPPAAHTAMEKAAAPAPLVQILATTPQTRSVVSPVEPPRPEAEHDFRQH
ncbi:CPBP family intramembrane glutamic endopeptidase [Granulicella tundricola]|uniref:Abortive infection protein n=1 Tax=Granulicella tundricola (strain ATCC BAA-1859 / DSM 23138 / MP5ACTX9) TaxID=1198114 RepID=E8X2L7_GRATM|nr:CPBP family intramembrane glutamic endopeptidase [Granulicella tundricola]ADW69241.1 Abortive infection protein [Granulicella tundricola MP5ACTX9]